MFLREFFRRTLATARRQTPDFRLMVWRRTLHGVSHGLTGQYEAIYAVMLGTNPVQLGSLLSVGNAVGALASIPAGWFIDYTGRRRVFLLATGLLMGSSLLYFSAPHWTWLYAAIMLFYLGERMTCTSCTVTCAAELPNQDRATGRGLCRSIGSIATLVTPLVAALLISRLGGMSQSSIRQLYGIQIIIFGGIFVLLLTRLSDSRASGTSGGGLQIVSSFGEIFKHGPDVVRLMLVIGLMQLPWTISQPFMPVYAHQFKGANEFMLSGIYMAMSMAPMLFSIPLGRLADRHGRKKLLFALAPLAYVANLMLVFAPTLGMGMPLFLLLYGLFFGFNHISMFVASAMAAEIMPKEQLGRWIGVISLFRGLLSIPAPLIGGLIWEHIGPEYVFFAVIAVDLLVRLPLLASIRETLHLPSDH